MSDRIWWIFAFLATGILLIPGCRGNLRAPGSTFSDSSHLTTAQRATVAPKADRTIRLAGYDPNSTDIPQEDTPQEDLPHEDTPQGMDANRRLPPAELPLPPKEIASPESSPELVSATETLDLEDVVVSVERSYPQLRVALLERGIADGEQLSSEGAFDLGIKGFSIAAPEGFYDNYRSGLVLEQPLWQGGYAYSGYKIGDGNFQPWYGERETNEGGEFSAGFGVPLLKNRAIDKRREALFKATLGRQAVEPDVRNQRILFVQMATHAYWTWVASGRALQAEKALLQLAQARVEQIQERVKAGDLPEITRINNEQLIASRETKVIQANRKLQQAAIKLSLFWRTAEGMPQLPKRDQLPVEFPGHTPPDVKQVDVDIAQAIEANPELVYLDLTAEQIRVELSQAENSLLPKVDMLLSASKDVGAAASSKGDKTPFEMEIGLYGDVPLQRREARGKILKSRHKLAQIRVKRQFVTDKIRARVQDALSALQAAANRIDRARTNLELARETLQLGRQQFNAGDTDLISLNIYELAVNDAQIVLIAAQADYFVAEADYRAALSIVSPTNSEAPDGR